MPDRPEPFSSYTTPQFWDDDHVSAQMLSYHLDPLSYPASRPHAFIDSSTEWLIGVLGLTSGDTLLDLGCGPGLYSTRLARRGLVVTGVDVSRRSIAYARDVARREHLTAEYRLADYLRDDLGGPYDAAILVYEDYCALSPAQRATLLGRVHLALRPGARMALDVTAAPRFDQVAPGVVDANDLDGGFWAEPPYVGRHETFTYPDDRLVLDRYTITKDDTTRQYWNWMHCLTPDQARAELAAGGFTDVELYGDVAGAAYDSLSGVFALVAAR